MSEHLQSAKQSIIAELQHAREGYAFYAARVQALEKALQELENVEGGKTVAPRGSRKSAGRPAKAGKAGNSNGMPKTGGDFWLELIGTEPMTAVEIANAAIAALNLKPTQKEEIKKIKQRVAPALAGLLSAHKIKDSGTGRDRRFYKEA